MASVRIPGSPAQLLQAMTFVWRAVVSYRTRQEVQPGRGPVDLPEARFEACARGPNAPPDLFQTAVVDWRAMNGYMARGRLTVEVEGTLPNGRHVRASLSDLSVVGENPQKSIVLRELQMPDHSVSEWLTAIACQESLGTFHQFHEGKPIAAQFL